MNKLIKQIEKALNEHGVAYEVQGSEYTFLLSSVCEILTDKCTIQVNRKGNSIIVNENPVEDIYEMIEFILQVEGL